MFATHGANVRRITSICVLLPTFFAISYCDTTRPDKRSLNNYVATSVPYTVQSHSLDMLDCVNDNHCMNNISVNEHGTSVEGTFRPYSQDELNKILQKYETDKDTLEAQESTNKIANYYSAANSNNIETSSPTSDLDKSKAWNLISFHQHQQLIHTNHPSTYASNNNNNNNHNTNNNNNNNKNPYDDRMGWVTLEPIAWSSSQVQKWEPNTKPSWPIPPSNNGPWGQPSLYQQQQTNFGGFAERPYKKPTYQYQSKPWNSKPQYNGHFGNQEIITDGQPGYFPNDRPSPSTQGSYKPAPQVISSTSAEEEGHWVLLSSTKGYSVPHRQSNYGRSLDVDKEAGVPAKSSYRPLSARRSIRLTVLPSLNGAKSTITSHDGMIEREATRQTVDEAHREHLARKMNFKEPKVLKLIIRSDATDLKNIDYVNSRISENKYV